MLVTEEMPTCWNTGHGVERKFVLSHVNGRKKLHHVLKEFHVEHKLLVARLKSALHPACRVINEVSAAENRTP